MDHVISSCIPQIIKKNWRGGLSSLSFFWLEYLLWNGADPGVCSPLLTGTVLPKGDLSLLLETCHLPLNPLYHCEWHSVLLAPIPLLLAGEGQLRHSSQFHAGLSPFPVCIEHEERRDLLFHQRHQREENCSPVYPNLQHLLAFVVIEDIRGF